MGVPTDTFYGLSADPFNLSAVERVYKIKGRPETKALPILVGSVEQAVNLARELPDNFLRSGAKVLAGRVDAGGGGDAPDSVQSDGEYGAEWRCDGRMRK